MRVEPNSVAYIPSRAGAARADGTVQPGGAPARIAVHEAI